MANTLTLPGLTSTLPTIDGQQITYDTLANPTIESGDVTVTIGAATNHAANLPTVNPDRSVTLELTEAEAVVGASVRFVDPDKQWLDVEACIFSVAQNLTPPPGGVANSVLARAVAAARELVANSPAFRLRQQQFGTGDGSIYDRILLYESTLRDLPRTTTDGQPVKNKMSDQRPFAIVDLAENINWESLHPGCTFEHLVISGSVAVVISDNARRTQLHRYDGDGNYAGPGDDSQGDSYIDFLNFSGGVLDDMSGVFGSSTDLFGFEGIDLQEPGVRSSHDERHNDDYWTAVAFFNFGDRQ